MVANQNIICLGRKKTLKSHHKMSTRESIIADEAQKNGSPRGLSQSETSRTTVSATPFTKNVPSKLSGHLQAKVLKQEGATKTGRWTRDEHFRFLEALKLFGKEWKNVQQHVGTRSSTQARSHAQKFFVKLQKKNKTLEQFVKALDLSNIQKSLVDQDVSDSADENHEEYVLSEAA